MHQRFQEHSFVSNDTSFKVTVDNFGYYLKARMHKLVLVLL
jgi:hypothetical protein